MSKRSGSEKVACEEGIIRVTEISFYTDLERSYKVRKQVDDERLKYVFEYRGMEYDEMIVADIAEALGCSHALYYAVTPKGICLGDLIITVLSDGQQIKEFRANIPPEEIFAFPPDAPIFLERELERHIPYEEITVKRLWAILSKSQITKA